MIETVEDYKKFLSEVCEHGIIIHVIPIDSNVHPVKSSPCILFIKDVITKITYCFSLGHGDINPIVDIKTIVNDLNALTKSKWSFDKKSTIQLFPINQLNDINLLTFLSANKRIEECNFETAAHKYVKFLSQNKVNLSIPLFKHQETFENMCKEFFENAASYIKDDGYLKENEIIIETLSEIEKNGIYVNKNCFRRFHENADVYDGDLVYSQYNIYTSTGRPSNRFQNVNYAALNKENGVRDCFISRFGKNGKMVLIDYSAFHPRIICHLTKFDLAIDVDIYRYLGELYFRKEDLSEDEMDESKKLTFRQLYGGVEEEYSTIKYLINLKDFIKTSWQFFQENGYVLTPIFKRRITNQHVIDPNPSKLFNYILQATETEIAMSSLRQINRYLSDKQTKAVLYTYDSILFDFSKTDGAQTLKDIISIMKMGDRFPIKVYVGDSYNDVKQIQL